MVIQTEYAGVNIHIGVGCKAVGRLVRVHRIGADSNFKITWFCWLRIVVACALCVNVIAGKCASNATLPDAGAVDFPLAVTSAETRFCRLTSCM